MKTKKQRLEEQLKNAIKAGNRSKAAWAIIELERLEDVSAPVVSPKPLASALGPFFHYPTKPFKVLPLNCYFCKMIEQDTVAYFKTTKLSDKEKQQYIQIARQWNFLSNIQSNIFGYFEVNGLVKNLIAAFNVSESSPNILDIDYIASHFESHHEEAMFKVVSFLKQFADGFNKVLRVQPYSDEVRFWTSQGFVETTGGYFTYNPVSDFGKSSPKEDTMKRDQLLYLYQ